MQALNYFLTLAASFLGLFIGLALALNSPEELVPGKKYFLILKKYSFIAACIAAFIYTFNNSLTTASIIMAGVLIFITLSKNQKLNDIAAYLLFSIAFYTLSKNASFLLVLSSFILLFGISTGTLIASSYKKQRVKNTLKIIFSDYSHYIIIALVLKVLKWLLY